VLLVHSEIYYVPVDDGWEVVLVCNVLHYVPVLKLFKRSTEMVEYKGTDEIRARELLFIRQAL
jgi:hypothetical protein